MPVNRKLTFCGINSNCIYLRICSALVILECGRKPEQMSSETRRSPIKIKCIKHCLCDICNLLAKQICCDYVRLNSCFGSWEKDLSIFTFSIKKSILKIQKVCSEQYALRWSHLWAIRMSTSSCQPSRDEKKIFHKTPKFCNFPTQQQRPQTVLKRQPDPEEHQARPMKSQN